MQEKVFPVDVTELLKAGTAMGEIKEDKECLYAVVPEGYKLSSLDLAERNEEMDERRWIQENQRPKRHRGKLLVSDVESFVAMVKRELIPATTIVFANLKGERFDAVINYAENGDVAGFADRHISLSLAQTTEFRRWSEKNRVRMSQLALADFIEENLESVTEPAAAEMVEMISNLKVKKNAKYHSVIDTKTGAQSVSFSEEIKGETQNGSIDFRGKFKIAIAPFYGSKPYSIDCNLRFSVSEERLQIFFAMINIQRVIDHAFEAERLRIIEAMKEIEVPVINISQM